MKNLLLVAFHFPPCGGGSGVHRATRFARYLGENGWRVSVLTANPRVYERVDPGMQQYLTPDIQVTRAFALDAQRHLAFRGRYLRLTAVCDRWMPWVLGAVPSGIKRIYQNRIDVVMVTFPIATAVLIGLMLQWFTRKPLVVDFRDSMTEENYPRDPLTRRFNRWIERSVIRRGSRFIFTARSARQMYLDRYPDLRPEQCVVVSNGYDEDDFAGITIGAPDGAPGAARPLRIIHSGVIYPDDRDPRAFFRAVQRLKQDGIISAKTVRIDFRACGSEAYYTDLLKHFGIDDIIQLLPTLPHKTALQDTAAADGLLLFQAASCDHQIPAKVYEYLRLRKPILAVTSLKGDTAAVLSESSGATIADLADENSIYDALSSFVAAVKSNRHSLPDADKVFRYTRRNQTRELAQVLNQIVSGPATEQERPLSAGRIEV